MSIKKINSFEDLKKIKFKDLDDNNSFKDLTVSENNIQNLEAHFSNKSRGGKTVTILKGFVGSLDELKVLSKKLKNYFGVGGSLKNGEIIIQGNIRDKIIIYLESFGHKVKRIGG